MVFLIYQLILILIILISPLIILYRILKNKEDSVRFREKFCFFSKSRKSGKLIWFHASSVGELMNILPIINYYENKKNINQILITSTTLSSAKILKNSQDLKYKYHDAGAFAIFPTVFMLKKKNRNTIFERLLLKKSHYSTSI